MFLARIRHHGIIRRVKELKNDATVLYNKVHALPEKEEYENLKDQEAILKNIIAQLYQISKIKYGS